jgi:methionyl-tRNA formyltransferase
MRICILTGARIGAAGQALPVLHQRSGVSIAGVILATGQGGSTLKRLQTKLRKTLRIGPVAAINGIRLRKWYFHTCAADVCTIAEKLGVPVVTVPHVNALSARDALRKFDVDLGISLGNGYISPGTFEIPKHGMVNYHGELLPEYPGALSIIWPIYFDRTKTGFTIHRIDRGIDTGPILLRREFEIVFGPSLRETVERTSQMIHPHLPEALAEVVSSWNELSTTSMRHNPGRSFTTPTFSEFLTMCRNNRRFYASQLRATSSRRAQANKRGSSLSV